MKLFLLCSIIFLLESKCFSYSERAYPMLKNFARYGSFTFLYCFNLKTFKFFIQGTNRDLQRIFGFMRDLRPVVNEEQDSVIKVYIHFKQTDHVLIRKL